MYSKNARRSNADTFTELFGDRRGQFSRNATAGRATTTVQSVRLSTEATKRVLSAVRRRRNGGQIAHLYASSLLTTVLTLFLTHRL